jgi:hypothetical protein
MARHESNREDLLHEATALVERVELVSPAGEQVVAGFRADGALSIFFGDDLVYQFNAAGELRRAYCGGLLYKSLQRRLVSLDRARNDNEVQLLRHDLTKAEQAMFVARMSECLSELANSIATNNMKVVRCVPPYTDVLTRLQTWLAHHRDWPIAARPNA